VRRALLLIVAVGLLAGVPARADVLITFAVPDEGRVTLGVFDGSGHLVRTLHALAPQENFRIGLNGLITGWDGKNDAGEPVPAGKYHVRGYLIGDEVGISGEDFLFNDFAADPGFPRFSTIRDFALLENGDLLLFATRPTGPEILARFSPDRGFLWAVPPRGVARSQYVQKFQATDSVAQPLGGSVLSRLEPGLSPDFPPILATNARAALLLSPNACGVYSLEGEELKPAREWGNAVPLAAAANGKDWFVSSAGGLTTIPISPENRATGEERPSIPPAVFTAMDADDDTLVGATHDAVWIRRGGFEKLPGIPGARSVALGVSGTFWFVAPDGTFVGQASFSGELLRTLQADPGAPQPLLIRASRTAERFAVLEERSGLQRLRLLSRTEAGEWVIDWERNLQAIQKFGFVDGLPVPDVGAAVPAQELRVHLRENPLTGRKEFLMVRAEVTPSGTRLVSPDGLPLVEVNGRPDITRAVIHRGATSDSLVFLQGDGTSVEQFAVHGMDDILPLDAGDIELP
jgi:hypothetical protein